MLHSEKCEDGCSPLSRSLAQQTATALISSSLPFAITFFLVATLAVQRLFPALSGLDSLKNDNDHVNLPAPSTAPRNQKVTSKYKHLIFSEKLAAACFSVIIALTTVLAELILCEITNTLNPAARTLALHLTINTLLFLLIVAAPILELHSLIRASGWGFSRGGTGRVRIGWLLEAAGFATWLFLFWWAGSRLIGSNAHSRQKDGVAKPLREACLERVGIIGVVLMASLAGFAAISAPWQNLFMKHKPVHESDISNKEAGLRSTTEMLAMKRHRLRAIDRKLTETPSEGFMSRVIGSLRGNPDIVEHRALQMEISGLEMMRLQQESSVNMSRDRLYSQSSAHTALGRFWRATSFVFSLYCIYRICATCFYTFRRYWLPSASFSQQDPINNTLAIVAKHLYPSLDRQAWAGYISFLLSGVILAASFNSTRTTFHFFSRFTPAVLSHAQANLALFISQISATYVISSALLLRSNLPKGLGSVITEALGAPLDQGYVDRWFEGWFLIAAGSTAVAIFVGRKISGEDDEEGETVEKLS
jgi:Abscisic acid G-protein coupled receptor/The Golgi pH Regulator (GPHR) Family N-terminal